MDDEYNIKLRFPALKFLYQTPTLIRKLTKLRTILRYYTIFYLRSLRSGVQYLSRLLITIAKSMKVNISNINAAIVQWTKREVEYSRVADDVVDYLGT